MLNPQALEEGLKDHEDIAFVNRIINYRINGVPIRYKGPHESRVSPKWPSAVKYSQPVLASIQKDIKLFIHNYTDTAIQSVSFVS